MSLHAADSALRGAEDVDVGRLTAHHDSDDDSDDESIDVRDGEETSGGSAESEPGSRPSLRKRDHDYLRETGSAYQRTTPPRNRQDGSVNRRRVNDDCDGGRVDASLLRHILDENAALTAANAALTAANSAFAEDVKRAREFPGGRLQGQEREELLSLRRGEHRGGALRNHVRWTCL